MSVIVAKAGACCVSGPISSISSSLPAINIQQLIPPSIPTTIDSISTVDWGSVKWMVVLTALDRSLIQSFEIYADHQYGINPSYNTYGILGDTISYTTSVSVISGQLTLQISNLEAQSLIAYVTRIAVPLRLSAVPPVSGVIITEAHAGVPGGTSQVVDSFNSWGTVAVKWIVTVSDLSDNKSTSQVFAVTLPGFTNSFNEYAEIGGLVEPYEILSVNSSSNETQLVVNNTGVDMLLVDVTRIPVQPTLPPKSIGSDISIVIPSNITIPVGSTINVDTTIPIPGHNAVKWLIYVQQPATNLCGAFELLASRDQLTTVTNVLYSILSTYFNLTVQTSIVGLNMELNITNNELYPVIVNLIRVPVSL